MDNECEKGEWYEGGLDYCKCGYEIEEVFEDVVESWADFGLVGA